MGNPYLLKGDVAWVEDKEEVDWEQGGARSRLFYRNRNHQQLQFQAVASLLPDTTGLTVLDYGCGYGDFSVLVPDAKYIGVEANPDVVMAGKRLYHDLDLRLGAFIEDADIIVAVAVVQCGIRDGWEMIDEFYEKARVMSIFTFWEGWTSSEDFLRRCPGWLRIIPPTGNGGDEDFVTVAMKR